MATTSAVLSQMSTHEGEKPDYVTIFQTMDNIQIMLPELGDRYALQAYFHFHGVRFILDQRTNAEDMSPDGLLPFIRHGNDLVSRYDKIVEYINTKNNIDYSSQSRPDIMALSVLFNEVVIKSELYYTWNSEIYDQFTKSHYPNGKPWPLTLFLCWLKKWDVSTKLGDTKNADLDFENLFSDLSNRLTNNKRYLFGDQPNELDTLVYGHIKAIYKYRDIYKNLYGIIEKFPNLIDFMRRIDDQLPKE